MNYDWVWNAAEMMTLKPKKVIKKLTQNHLYEWCLTIDTNSSFTHLLIIFLCYFLEIHLLNKIFSLIHWALLTCIRKGYLHDILIFEVKSAEYKCRIEKDLDQFSKVDKWDNAKFGGITVKRYYPTEIEMEEKSYYLKNDLWSLTMFRKPLLVY